MTISTRVIAFYLPQFHEIPENNLWWGKGFTEWTNVAKARPLFTDHYQPHEPLDDFYYDLAEDSVFSSQIELARKYGVGGFCFYHYWFKGGKKLLEKPVEAFLANQSHDFPFCLSWANEPWTRRWDGAENEVLMVQDYGDKADWANHFDYLLPFLKDKRYITHHGMPLILIYKPNQIPCALEMLSYWRRLAQNAGLPGLALAWQYPSYLLDCSTIADHFDLFIEFEPFFTLAKRNALEGNFGHLRELLLSIARGKSSGIASLRYYVSKLIASFLPARIADWLSQPKVYDYREVIRLGEDRPIHSAKSVPGVFTSWDNTPRRGRKSTVFLNSSPNLFKSYLNSKLLRNRLEYKKEFIFVNAWNEWAEGAHLEPDKLHANGYLEAIAESRRDL